MSIALRLLLTFEGVAILLTGLAVPLWKRRVPPNRLYGFRTPKTLSNPELWAVVNEKTGFDTVLIGVSLGVLAAGLFMAGASIDVFVSICVGWLLTGIVISVIHGFLLIRTSR